MADFNIEDVFVSSNPSPVSSKSVKSDRATEWYIKVADEEEVDKVLQNKRYGILNANKVEMARITEQHFKENVTHPLIPNVEACVVISGLPYDVAEDDVHDFFSGFDLNQDMPVTLITHKDGKPTGRAFVNLESPLEAHRAMWTMNRSFLGSRWIQVTHYNDVNTPRYLQQEGNAAVASRPNRKGKTVLAKSLFEEDEPKMEEVKEEETKEEEEEEKKEEEEKEVLNS
eukprot:TRINITY_DN7753_c0_g1_i2.p1 TRINITY_DN7753_c0_g1~~TRINITY_DN7753_c0_g1_i2.p1  ORF type:complete len:228 (-),score=100.06 TRINITY_DN7753_c0_g1_i2:14-697(-)